MKNINYLTTDWLNSKPIFYNSYNNKYSHIMSDLIDKKINFDREGLRNYFDYGYSVFQQTPIKEIKFLDSSSKIELDKNSILKISKLNDPFEKFITYKLREEEIFELIREKVKKWEASLPQDHFILIPLSGGFDSRILLNSITNKDRVKAFTYGLSTNQELSTETIKAKYLCEKFGISWTQIKLGKYNNEIKNWVKLYGLSTHAHGMYHIEFYKKIKKMFPNTKFSVLSGIVGDAWAGSLPKYNIRNYEDLNSLGCIRGLNANSNFLIDNNNDMFNKKNFFKNNIYKFEDYRYQIVFLVRIKMILLSYLLNIPRKIGFDSWSPFLEIDIASSMLNVDPKRRKGRKWQKEFFKKNNLYIEEKLNKGDRRNLLDINSLKGANFVPLDYSLLESKININYLKFINKNISFNKMGFYYNEILNIPKIGGLLKKVGFKSKFHEAYYAYLCIYPLQYFIQKYELDFK